MRPALALPVLAGRLASLAKAQVEHHQHHGRPLPSIQEEASLPASGSTDHGTDHGTHHSNHGHDIGPSGGTYDLRWLNAMVQHHTGALRMGGSAPSKNNRVSWFL